MDKTKTIEIELQKATIIAAVTLIRTKDVLLNTILQ